MQVSRLFMLTALAPLAVSAPAFAQDLPPLPIQINLDRAINSGRAGRYREGCEADGRQLRAIAYTDTDAQATASALTSQAQPTLWFYLPFPTDEGTRTTLVLKSGLDATLYEGNFSGATDRSGIVGVSLPISLALGDAYQWSLVFNCTNGEQSVLSGWIERRAIDSALHQTFERVSDRNRAALYANYGFLQDALSELASLKLANPEDKILSEAWSTLLSGLNLPELASEPLLNCCQLGMTDPEEEILEQPEEQPEEPLEEPLEEQPEEPLEEQSEEPLEEPEDSEPEDAEPEEERTILQRARDRG